MTGRAVYIRGNHEEFFLGALAGNLSMLQDWLIYGGAECAASYGVSEGWILNSTVEEIRERLVDNVPKAHIDFLSSMADSFKFGDYLLVHAGIRPGVPFDQQVGQDLRWIREDFLESNADHGMVVVHGHTIAEEPEVRSNRIGIDTGAYRTGVLTALAIEGGDRWFLEAIGQPG
jgi:serine/threonine protein phosphatase 1